MPYILFDQQFAAGVLNNWGSFRARGIFQMEVSSIHAKADQVGQHLMPCISLMDRLWAKVWTISNIIFKFSYLTGTGWTIWYCQVISRVNSESCTKVILNHIHLVQNISILILNHIHLVQNIRFYIENLAGMLWEKSHLSRTSCINKLKSESYPANIRISVQSHKKKGGTHMHNQ